MFLHKLTNVTFLSHFYLPFFFFGVDEKFGNLSNACDLGNGVCHYEWLHIEMKRDKMKKLC
jgi:hypothetical protein